MAGVGGTGNIKDDVVPLLGIGRAVGLELKLRSTGQAAAHRLAAILTLDAELVAAGRANDGVRQVDAHLRNGVLADVVRVLELVQEARGTDNVVASAGAEAELVAALPLETTLDHGVGALVVLIGEGDGLDCAGRLVAVDKDIAEALVEALPLHVRRDALDGAQHVTVQSADAVGLAAGEHVEGLHGLLQDLNDVSLERLKVGLDGDEVVAVVVLLDDLLVEAVQDTTVDDIGVLGGLELAASGLEGGSLLAQQLNMLLCELAGLLDLLGTLLGAVRQLLGLVLDLLVQALKHRQDGALEVLLSLEVSVDQGLGVGAHVVEEAVHAAEL